MAAVIISALLTAASMPGMLWGGLIWFALVPLFFELNRSSLLSGIIKAFAFAYVYLLLSHFWVFPVLSRNVPDVLETFPPFVGTVTFFLMGLIMAAPFAGFGLAYMLLKDHLWKNRLFSSLVVASLFVVFESIRGYGPLGFTGGRLSHALINDLGLLQLLPLGGTLLLVFLIVSVNYILYTIMPKAFLKKAALVMIVLGCVFSISSLLERFVPRIAVGDGESGEVVAVQTNFPQSIKYNEPASVVLAVVEDALRSVPEGSWVVMPEATFMSDIRNNYVGSRLQEIVSERDLSVLIGFPTYNDKNYNQVRIIDSNGFGEEFYAKMKPTPFVEILPYPRIFGLFGFLRFLDFFSPGEEYTVFDFAFTNLAVQICFDSYYPEVSRGLVKAGGQVLVTSTNDGWFDHNTALQQHFAQMIFRSVENRRFGIQVSNTGISGVIDPYGRTLKTFPTVFETDEVFLLDTLNFVPRDDQTLYNSYGEWIFTASLMIIGLYLFVVMISPQIKKARKS